MRSIDFQLGGIIRVKSADGAFLCEFLGCRALGSEIEDEDLKPAQKLPDCFMIVGSSRIKQMRPGPQSDCQPVHLMPGSSR